MEQGCTFRAKLQVPRCINTALPAKKVPAGYGMQPRALGAADTRGILAGRLLTAGPNAACMACTSELVSASSSEQALSPGS